MGFLVSMCDDRSLCLGGVQIGKGIGKSGDMDLSF